MATNGPTARVYFGLKGVYQAQELRDEVEVDLGGWAYLPDILLERIFSFLPIKNLSRCARICWNWKRIYETSNEAWETFVYKDYTFTKRKFTIHAGWQYVIDHFRLRLLIARASRQWRHIVIKPVSNLTNEYEFLRTLTNFTEYYEKNKEERPLKDVRSFEFDWELYNPAEEGRVFVGTGGEILSNVNHVLSHLFGLRFLALRQLQLDVKEADRFMDDLVQYFSMTLRVLSLINLTKMPHSFLHLGLFLNLRKLIVSPQHLNNDVLFLLASHRTMQHLVLIQDEETEGAVACDERAWKELRRLAPMFQVHLHVKGRCRDDIIYQPCAPVVSLVYDSSYSQLTPQNAMAIVENYSETLESFVQRGLQRRFRSRAFDERADTNVVMLVRHCSQLKFLAIREHISTATLLLAGQLSKYNRISTLCVRRNAVLKRADWPFNEAQWSTKFYSWLRHSARSYERTEEEMRKLMGESWRLMTDNEYLHAV